MSSLTIPGISVPGKLLLAKISDELVILMLGIIGHETPIFSITDLSRITNEIEASTLSFIMHFVDFAASGTLFETTPSFFQTCNPSVHLRLAFHNAAAFWAFSFLITQTSHVGVGSIGLADHQNILRTLDFFKHDQGPELAMGGPVLSLDANPPPDYAEAPLPHI
ncbi:hypothetical protein B0H11DRAFT_1914940 [Mycena galericulata]|nr:hypothetical protein B0H11DRAFT_1914940 [Mycena galericulata]